MDEPLLADHFSLSAPLCLDKTQIHHFAGVQTLFHSCLTRILRDPSCICFYAFCLRACVTQTHSTFCTQQPRLTATNSQFFLIHKGTGKTEPLHAFSALDLNPSCFGSRQHQPLNVSAVQCVRWLVVHRVQYSRELF